ncbi:MAG: hypothetical protein EAZ97_07450 [Bacteroidetes bacterium]|nr:MAG: hypothetical protein EAZ97_07450 [Bacteroidota bacterium]
MQDLEDIENQSKRLGKLLTGNIPENLAEIMAVLENQNYWEAVRLIQVFLQNMAVAHYIDPEISGMSLEIKALEIQISSLENEKADIEKLLANYAMRYHQVLGDLLLEIMDLQKRLSKKEDEKQEK